MGDPIMEKRFLCCEKKYNFVLNFFLHSCHINKNILLNIIQSGLIVKYLDNLYEILSSNFININVPKKKILTQLFVILKIL